MKKTILVIILTVWAWIAAYAIYVTTLPPYSPPSSGTVSYEYEEEVWMIGDSEVLVQRIPSDVKDLMKGEVEE